MCTSVSPCIAPAARVIDSFIRQPPKSLQPTASKAAAPPGPIFTHEACRVGEMGERDRGVEEEGVKGGSGGG